MALTVDEQIDIFRGAKAFYKLGYLARAHDLITSLRKEYPHSIHLLVWYAKTCDNSVTAQHVIYKAYLRDPDSLEVLEAYGELQAKWHWVY